MTNCEYLSFIAAKLEASVRTQGMTPETADRSWTSVFIEDMENR